MTITVGYKLCRKFTRLKERGFDDVKALDMLEIKGKIVQNRLLAWYEAKVMREAFFKRKYELAQKYIELKNSGIDSNQALGLLGLKADEQRELLHFIALHINEVKTVKEPQIQEYSSADIRSYKEIISKIKRVGGQNRTPEWIIKNYGVTAYTAGIIWRELNKAT